MKTLVRRGLEKAGYRVTALVPSDVEPWERAIWETVRPFTMTPLERVISSIRAGQYVARHEIQGAIVECGVWKGGNSMAMAMGALHEGDSSRTLWLYDTYEAGMTQPGAFDIDLVTRQNASDGERNHWGYTPAQLTQVQQALSQLNLPAKQLRFVRGRVQDTIPGEMPDRIALLRLDTDFYDSTKHELVHLWPRLVSQGICIIDDYGHYGGCAKAVDEYFSIYAERPVFLSRIDYSARLIVKH